MSMTERERKLLELAAKAAGIAVDKSRSNGGPPNNDGFDIVGNLVVDWHNGKTWNPLTDDGDAFRLLAALYMQIEIQPQGKDFVEVTVKIAGARRAQITDRVENRASTLRQAIVRAAADLESSR